MPLLFPILFDEKLSSNIGNTFSYKKHFKNIKIYYKVIKKSLISNNNNNKKNRNRKGNFRFIYIIKLF